ncbi:MAG: hypothetical protein OER83_03675 [Flavobacteriaceae bacterium]|nr:hypothetical protein [Flavobacteriaceae bacterium]MDH3795953.1 hypothetical protein [Flavobacteriaceae bacterium]
MKHLIRISLLIVLLIAIACDSGTNVDDGSTDLLIANAKTTSKQTVDVFDGTDEEFPIVGTSTLHRNANGITMNFKAEGLDKGYTYTVWWVIWNFPENCFEGCDDPDFATPDAVGVDVLYAGGNVAGNAGKIAISGHLNEEDTSGSIRELFGLGVPIGLLDAESAEVHLVLRSHGPAIPGMVNEQISSYEGGCTDPFAFPPFTEVPDAVGECGDIYFSVHIAE